MLRTRNVANYTRYNCIFTVRVACTRTVRVRYWERAVRTLIRITNISRGHCQNQEQMCNKIIAKDPTTPQEF